MAILVVDTDVLIDFLAGIEPSASRIVKGLESGTLHTTVINRFELLSGAKKSQHKELTEKLLEALTTISLDPNAADKAAEIRITLEAAGKTIGMGDSLIAGIVLSQKGILLTRNRRHFERVEGLKLEDF